VFFWFDGFFSSFLVVFFFGGFFTFFGREVLELFVFFVFLLGEVCFRVLVFGVFGVLWSFFWGVFLF